MAEGLTDVLGICKCVLRASLDSFPWILHFLSTVSAINSKLLMEGKTYSTATSPYKLVLNCSRFPNRPAHRRKRWEKEDRDAQIVTIPPAVSYTASDSFLRTRKFPFPSQLSLWQVQPRHIVLTTIGGVERLAVDAVLGLQAHRHTVDIYTSHHDNRVANHNYIHGQAHCTSTTSFRHSLAHARASSTFCFLRTTIAPDSVSFEFARGRVRHLFCGPAFNMHTLPSDFGR